jgi:RNA polymerase sigma factor (sigma-70 family)
MDSQGSVTRLIEQMRSAEPGLREDAARGLWDRYVPALLNLARHHLDRRLLRREDENDVLQSMYASFCIRQQRGNFDLSGRDDLWKLLVTVTIRKARNAARRHRRDARDYRREGDPGGRDSSGGDCDLEPCDVSEPTPADAAAFNDELERRLRALGDPVLRRIALFKLEGYTNKEIARELDNCTERTIERKLARIRTRWAGCDEANE